MNDTNTNKKRNKMDKNNMNNNNNNNNREISNSSQQQQQIKSIPEILLPQTKADAHVALSTPSNLPAKSSPIPFMNAKALPSENKVLGNEASGVMIKEADLGSSSSPKLIPAVVPGSPLFTSPMFSHQNKSRSRTNSISGLSSRNGNNNNNNSRSSTVIETRHIQLEYDPVRKRKLLNTYEIIGDLGSGQHGKVKLAIDTVSGDKVAIKILDRTGKSKVGGGYYGKLVARNGSGAGVNNWDMANGSDNEISFMSENELKIRKEIAIMKKCNHRNIVKLREVIDDHRLRKIYLVLEYLEKGEINWQVDDDSKNIEHCQQELEREYIYKPALSFKKARAVFRDVVLGLEYLHYQGIIHRDIKPANLLISNDNIVKISDFGVSFSITLIEDNEYELCKTAGTPAFYAPELCSLDREINCSIISHKIDIWALGVTLYCLIFGNLPFYGKNDFELFDRINKAEMKVLSFQEFKALGIPENDRLQPSEYDDFIDLLEKLLQKNPYQRIDIPEIKDHAFLRSSLSTQEEAYNFENNLLINYPLDFTENCSPERNGDECKIDVTQEEMGNAITDIGGKIKLSLNKVLNLTGFSSASSSTPSLTSKKSVPMMSPTSSPKLQGNLTSRRHRLSISSVFSRKNGSTHSRSNSTTSSKKNSGGNNNNNNNNTVYTPSHVQTLSHEDSSSSLRSRFSINSDNSSDPSNGKKSNHDPNTLSPPLYMHSNLTSTSFISPSLQSVQMMDQSQDYFSHHPGSENNNNNEDYVGSRSGSQISLRSKNFVVQLNQANKTADSSTSINNLASGSHRRTASNGSAQLSDAFIEGGFFVHTKPVANTLNGIVERNDRKLSVISDHSTPQLAVNESPLNSPGLKSNHSGSFFGSGSKSRNSSFLNGYNIGITLPRKGSNISLPVNSSYASLNSFDDDLLYSQAANTTDRMIRYSTTTPTGLPPPATVGMPQNVSGFLNNANSASGFLNNEVQKFRFFEDSIREKVYGQKNGDLSKLEEYSMKESMLGALEAATTAATVEKLPKGIFPTTVSTTQRDSNYVASKAPSVSTINEIQSGQNLVTNFRPPKRADSEGDDESDNTDGDDEDDIIQFNADNYRDRTGGRSFFLNGGSSGENSDSESFNTVNQTELKLVDSVVTVPNSLISKLNSADNLKSPSQTQLSLFNNINPDHHHRPKKKRDHQQSKFQFGGDSDESDDTDDSNDGYVNDVPFGRPDLLRQQLMAQRAFGAGGSPISRAQSQYSTKSSGDDSDQELTFNFASRKLVGQV